jgi:tripartite-type tricarboxylate transporter receptor subunit TctC
MTIISRTLRMLARLAAASLGFAAAAPALADAFPNKPITILVGFAAGGGNDFVARAVAKEMAADLGQPVVVENRPGSGGETAVALLARSAPDGYTMLLGSNGALTISPTLREKLPYATSDIEPIGMMTKTPLVFAVPASSPFGSVADVVAAAKRTPGKLTYASSGNGTNLHLTSELFLAQSGTTILHVPYKGGSQAITDVVSGTVDMIFSQVSVVQPLIKAGKLKALGITSEERSELLPEVAPIADKLPGFASVSWNGLFVRAGTPDAVKQALYRSMQKAVRSPNTKKLFAEQGLDSFEMDAVQTKRYMAAETDKWAKIIRGANIKL